MAGVISHLSSFARFAVQRRSREAADASVMGELSAAGLGLPRGLQLQWLGVAGYRLTYEGHTLYVDPYLSRVSLGEVLRSRAVRVQRELHDRHLGDGRGKVVGILVGHTHFDHAIDVPALAARFDAKVYGSDSLAHLMALHGMGERAVRVEARRVYELGPFAVRFIPSLHSKLLLGYKVPFDGELTCEHLNQLSPAAYRCGAVHGIHITVAGTTLYHQGSANLIDSALQGVRAEIFLAGIAGRSFTPAYWPRILTALGPRLVIASHFDDFFRPLSDPLGFSTNVNLAAFPEEIGAVSRDIAVAAMRPLQTVEGAGPADR